jgi:hypothetical protein
MAAANPNRPEVGDILVVIRELLPRLLPRSDWTASRPCPARVVNMNNG